MNLGRSFIDFGSTATVTTGSDMCLIASNGGASFSLAMVTPAAALLIPVIAAIFPDVTSEVAILSPPTIMPTCCTLSAFAAPMAQTDSPCLILPEYTLPTATSPACGSIQIFVIISERGPSGSHSIIAFPTPESKSPCQILGILYFCAITGEGCFSTVMSNKTVWTGASLASSFWLSL